MNFTPLLLTTAALVTTVAAAQTSTISGFAALALIGKARGVALNPAALQAVKAGTPAYDALLKSLRVSPAVLSNLLTYGNKPAPTLLLTRAVLESASGKVLTDAQVGALIAANPDMAVTSAESLTSAISNPTTLALANSAAKNATSPVTPRGAGD
ncbi:hypothetical protein HNQ07_002107 [Deinococcus metalli]|uniref:Uncharacterized protein n=1 Tax=Deinococcus metalli TaxID=1141878 RepID=A0A7W8KGE1_9DEIO|nr:hypothetical protein [Deinococcus metalli]MBB5376643.1 hypothetical protein [Deinococcus metalli]GHF42562.1 hypothetical protein GCM10017781_18590 [Deinococcus metalli]